MQRCAIYYITKIETILICDVSRPNGTCWLPADRLVASVVLVLSVML